MCHLKPLKPSVGQPADGEQFFPRPKIRRKILRILNNGENILLSAPRRIGKTSLLKAIHPEEGQIIKYLVIQSVYSSEDFFRLLYRELITDHEIYRGAKSYLKQTTHTVIRYLNRIRGVSIEGEIEIGKQDLIDYYCECYKLMQKFEGKKIILFIDEFPDAVSNMAKRDRDLAIYFLQQHRDLRQQFSHNNLQFVYTGSTGLRNVVSKIGKLDLINDLNEITLSTFSKQEAHDLIQRLVLYYQSYLPDFSISEAQIEIILEKISWRLPYYLQAIIQSLSYLHEDNEHPISDSDIDAVLIAMTQPRSPYSAYFENWRYRLQQTLEEDECALAMAILSHSAVHNALDTKTRKALITQYPHISFKAILQILEFDGYLNQEHRFNSNLLQQWWLQNIVE